MGIGRGQDFQIFCKNGYFLTFECSKKQSLPLLSPLEKLLPKSSSDPWTKIDLL